MRAWDGTKSLLGCFNFFKIEIEINFLGELGIIH